VREILLVARSRRLVTSCGCEDGCPGCIGLELGVGAPRTRPRRTLVLSVLDALGLDA